MTQYKKLSDVEHVLARSGMYIGQVTITEAMRIVLSDGVMTDVSMLISEGLERIILETLSNAGDNVERSRKDGIDPGMIRVTIRGQVITIYNEGKSIPIEIHPEYNVHTPQLIFSDPRTSSNFDDSETRTLIGMNGLGVKLTNIFSKQFKVTIGNTYNNKTYTQLFEKNMSVIHAPVITDGAEKNFVRVAFKPDFDRFFKGSSLEGERGFTTAMAQLIERYAADMSFTCKVPVEFHLQDDEKKHYELTSVKQYAELYVPDLEERGHIMWTDDSSELLLIDTPNAGRCVSFVNGQITQTGVHVDAWLKCFTSPILDKYKKEKIRLSDVTPHITLILSCRLDKPTFRSQTKEHLTAPKPSTEVPTDTVNTIMTWEVVRMIEERVAQKVDMLMSKTDGKRVSFIKGIISGRDAPNAGHVKKGQECTLFLTEGKSAASLFMKALADNDYAGVLPLRGKLLNVAKAKSEKTSLNAEITKIKQMLGLRHKVDYSDEAERRKLRYGKVVLSTDQDVDGFHIRGLILNFFRKMYPELIDCGFVCFMDTPLLTATHPKSKEIRIFHTEREYEREKENLKGWKVRYYKGLGTIPDGDIKRIFETEPVVPFENDDYSEEMLSLAFDEGNEDDRKSWLNNFVTGEYAHLERGSSISQFILTDMVTFSYDDLVRSIPSVWDGLKPTQRKILHVMRKHAGKQMKTSEYAGIVSSETLYHHGTDSMTDAIAMMAARYAGTNNIPLVQGDGQFASRVNHKPAAPRYTECKIAPITKHLIRTEDDVLLTYRIDGTPREPLQFFPLLPLWAVNGVKGIGTGYSTYIPSHSPLDVLQWIIDEIDGVEHVDTLKPWYRYYKGEITREGDRWRCRGRIVRLDNGDVIVSELPVYDCFESYKEKVLESMIENKELKSYKEAHSGTMYKDFGVQHEEMYARFYLHAPRLSSMEALRLQDTLSTKNMVLFDANGKCQKYTDISQLMKYFVKVRLDKYDERRQRIIPILTAQKNDLELKRRFLDDVINKRLKINNRPKSEVNEDMQSRGYPVEFLRTAVSDFTRESLHELDGKIQKVKDEIKYYEETPSAEMYKSELLELKKHLPKEVHGDDE